MAVPTPQAPQSGGLICHYCGFLLPLREPAPAENATAYQCVNCGEYYRGIFDEATRPGVHGNVRALRHQV